MKPEQIVRTVDQIGIGEIEALAIKGRFMGQERIITVRLDNIFAFRVTPDVERDFLHDGGWIAGDAGKNEITMRLYRALLMELEAEQYQHE